MSSRNITTNSPASADSALRSPVRKTGTMSVRKFFATAWIDAVTLVVSFFAFVVPFVFIILTAAKTSQEAGLFQFSWPANFQLIQNIQDVMAYGDGRMFRALFNSTVLTVGSVTLIVLIAALTAYVMQRRHGRVSNIASSVILAG